MKRKVEDAENLDKLFIGSLKDVRTYCSAQVSTHCKVDVKKFWQKVKPIFTNKQNVSQKNIVIVEKDKMTLKK